MLSGTLSVAASTTLATMILTSPRKLTSPKRRLLFGLCICDIFQSTGSILGPLLTVPDAPGSTSLWSFGNQATCDFQAFILSFGISNCSFYAMFLSMYFHHSVNLGMSNEHFAEKYERYMHVVTMLYSSVTSSVYLAFGNFNNHPNGAMCFTFDSPYGCHANTDTPCIRGAHALTVGLYMTFIPLACVCAALHYYLISLYLFVKKDGDRQRRRFTLGLRASTQSRPSASIQSGRASQISQNEDIERQQRRFSLNLWGNRTSIQSGRASQITETEDIEGFLARLQASLTGRSTRGNVQNPVYVTRAERRSTALTQQTLNQSLAYAGAYVSTFSLPVFSFLIWELHGKKQPSVFGLFLHTIYPLQGVLNVLVYTKAQVQTLRERNPKFFYYEALWLVIKNGGEIPFEYQRRRRRTMGWPGNEIPIDMRT